MSESGPPVAADPRIEVREARIREVVPALLVLAAGLVLYRATLLPGLGLWDTAEFQAVAPLLGVAHPTGFPAYVLLGFGWTTIVRPLLEPATAMNALSAVSVAIAAAATVAVVRRLTAQPAVAVAAGIGLALTPSAWQISTRADPHALHLALVALLLLALLRWRDAEADGADPDRRLLVVAALAAVAAGNHSLVLLLAPGAAAYVVATDPSVVRRPRLVLGCATLFAAIVGLLYLELPLRAGPFPAALVYGHPETWDGFRYLVSGEQFRQSLVSIDLLRTISVTAGVFAAQLGPLAPLVPLGFLVTLVRLPRWALVTGAGALVTCLFSASYANAAIWRYYLGPLLFAWTWLAIGAATVVELATGAVSAAGGEEGAPAAPSTGGELPDRIVVGLAGLVAAGLLLAPAALDFGRRFGLADESADRSATIWTDAALDPGSGFAPHAVVLSWWSFSTPLWYEQLVDGRRPDLRILDDRDRLDENLGDLTTVIDATLGQRPVYAVRVDPAELALLESRYVLERLALPGQPALRIVSRRAGS